MSELEDRINAVLNDPAQMEQIMGLARSLSGGEEPPQSAPAGGGSGMLGKLGELAKSFVGGGETEDTPALDPAVLGRLSRLMNGGGDSREQALLEAMKPYLSEKRRGKMDRAMKLAKMARLARIAMGETGGEGGGL